MSIGAAVRAPGHVAAVIAVVLIGIGALLAPVGVATSWARGEALHTDAFLTTFAPLGEDARIQNAVQAATITAVTRRLSPPVDDLVEKAMTPPLRDYVASDAFQRQWKSLLRTTHDEAVAALRGDSSSVIRIDGSDAIGVRIGPVVEAVKTRMTHEGMAVARLIPAASGTVTIADADAAAAAQRWYQPVLDAGLITPFLAAASVVGGLLLARRRLRAAAMWAAVAIALTMCAAVVLAAVGGGAITDAVRSAVAADAARVAYRAASSEVVAECVAIGIIAVSAALVCWLLGETRAAAQFRRTVGTGAASARATFGVRDDSRTVQWVAEHTAVLGGAVVVVGAAIIMVVPLRPGPIAWVLAGTAIAAAVLLIGGAAGRPQRSDPHQSERAAS